MTLNHYLTAIVITLSINTFAQSKTSEELLRTKIDSILVEADILYKLEKAAWITTDMAMEIKPIQENYGGYFAYQTDNAFKAIILNKEKECILETVFTDNFNKPSSELIFTRSLTETERHLLSIKNSIVSQIINETYEVYSPEGYSLNLILLPFESGYKLYIITGTNQNNVIPFGNDYLFYADKEGKITSWRRFHSRLIPTFTKSPDGETVISTMHSHLKTEPYITATDICTFRLYGSLYGQNEFTVYSPALSKSFRYLLNQNKVEIKDGL